MSERPDVFMPLFIGDYLAGTSRLTTELHGAYLLLIMDYWMNGAPPDNDQVLAAITKMSVDAWSIARASLEHFFSIENGCWKHKRIEQELSTAIIKKAESKAKAEKAAAARWAKDKNNAPSNAPSTPQALLEECPSPSPSPSPIETNTKSLADARALAETAEKQSQAKPKKIKISIDEFLKTNDLKKILESIRPELLDRYDGILLAFKVFYAEQSPIRDDWLTCWERWVRREKT